MINDLKREGTEITFPTFLDMMSAKIETQKDIDKVFHLFDHEQTG
jgi:Ca2+-binding EF-hand superfamily protein